MPDPNSPHGAYRLEIISACSEGSGDSTIDYPCSDFTSGMVGVDWLWVHTEEALMETMCRHRIVRAAFNVDLARNPVPESKDGALLPLSVACDGQYIQKQAKKALQCQLCRVQGCT